MDAGVAPADVRPGWLSHRDVSHSWLAGIPSPAAYFMDCNAVAAAKSSALAILSLLYLAARVLSPCLRKDELLLRLLCFLSSRT